LNSEPERIGAVVAAQKNCYPLNRCLNSLRELFCDPSALIFVDNGSKEGLGSWAKEYFPNITVVRLGENRYFCGGYNAGMRLAIERGYDFVLIINADTEVVNFGFLQAMLKAESRWPRAAFLGPQVFWRDPGVIQKTCLRFPNVVRSSLEWLPWRIRHGYFEKQSQEETVVEFLNGVCVLCRVEALKEIGLLDENMGGYGEDADWSWRARQKGWISLFSPVPSVVHYENTSGYEPYSLKTFLLKRNTVYWFLKIGKRRSAQCYALASMVLAMIKFLAPARAGERRKHRYFLQRSIRAFNGLLRSEPLGDWFGPPMGAWESEDEF
jgi:GT2 family glycosyltransferase